MVVNLEGAFKFPFRDAKWAVKILIGGLLLFVPIANFLVLGYLLRILGDARENKEAVLPEWKDWGMLFQEGFMAFIVLLCYSMVLVVLSLVGQIPLLGCILLPVQMAAGFLLMPVVSVALCFYQEKKELGAAFDFKSIIERLKNNIADYIVVALIAGILGMFAVMTLFLAVFVWFYISVASFRLYGEAFSKQPA